MLLRREATKHKRLCALQQATQKQQVTRRQQVREQNVSSQEGDEGDATSDKDEIINEIFFEESSNADDRVTANQTEDGSCNEETLMMPLTEDDEPVFRCDYCKGLEGALSTSKQHCKHLELVNEKLTTKVVSRESLCHDNIIKVQYYTGLPSYEILEIVFEFVTDGLPDILLLALVMCLTNSSWF